MRRVHTLALFAGLASATFAARASAQDAPAQATVSVRSPYPDVTIGYVTERATAVVSNGAYAVGMAWRDVCIAPCTFQLPQGLHELVASGPGYVSGSRRVELEPGNNHFVVRPGSAVVRIGGAALVTLGVVALALGVTFYFVGVSHTDNQGNITSSPPSWALPLAVTGGVATAGGIAMVAMSSTSIETEGTTTAARSRVLGIGLAGRF